VDTQLLEPVAELVWAPEPAISIQVAAPGGAADPGDVTGPRVRRLELPEIARSPSGIQEQDVIRKMAHGVVVQLHRCPRWAGDEVAVGTCSPSSLQPPGPSGQPVVEDGDQVVAEVAERPPQPACREPVAIVVDDDGGVTVDASGTHRLLERLAMGEWMTATAGLMARQALRLEVDEHRTRNVPCLVSRSARLVLLPPEVDHAEIGSLRWTANQGASTTGPNVLIAEHM